MYIDRYEYYIIFSRLKLDAVEQIQEKLSGKASARIIKNKSSYRLSIKIDETNAMVLCAAIKKMISKLKIDKSQYMFKLYYKTNCDEGVMSIPCHITKLHASVGGNIVFHSKLLYYRPGTYIF